MAARGKGELEILLREVRACRLCEDSLPLGPHPVLRAASSARILVAGQAPGTRVHATGIPWNDPSGERLREWMDVDREIFYDESRIAIIPMGFCYPGKGRSGDLPPRPECAEHYMKRLLALLPKLRLVLPIGQYAHRYHLGAARHDTLTETVRCFRDYGAGLLPLPHPSPRNNLWLRRNPWFESEVIPELRRRCCPLLSGRGLRPRREESRKTRRAPLAG